MTRYPSIHWHRLPEGVSLHDVKVRIGVGKAYPLTWRSSRMPWRRAVQNIERYYRIADRFKFPLLWGEWTVAWGVEGCRRPDQLACLLYQISKHTRSSRPAHVLWEVTRSREWGDSLRVMAMVTDWYMTPEYSVETILESPEGWVFKGPMTAYSHIDETV